MIFLEKEGVCCTVANVHDLKLVYSNKAKKSHFPVGTFKSGILVPW